MKLAIVISHPIQYNAPWFKLLADSKIISPLVFYTWGKEGAGAKYDPDFRREIEWDIPLLDGYEYRFVKNISQDPGTHHFKGISNPELIAEIEHWRPDAILIFGWNFHSHLRCLRHFHGKIPVLFRGDSTLLDERPGVRKFLRRTFLKWIYSHVDYALYVGTNNKKYFLAHGLKEEQLIFAPHAVDNQRFLTPGETYDLQAREWRLRLGIKEDELVLLFAGKLEPKKNPLFLLELAKNIDESRLKILIVGNGILEARLKIAAESDPRILFMNFQNQRQMPILYRVADIYILPSSGPGETWGLAVNEAMASGRPVIVSDKVGCAVDLVQEGHNGLILSSGDLGKSIEYISALLKDRSRLSLMGHKSRQIILAYSYRKIIDALEKVVKF